MVHKALSLLAAAAAAVATAGVEGYTSCVDKTFSGDGLAITPIPGATQLVVKGVAVDSKTGNVASIGVTLMTKVPHRFAVVSHDPTGKERWQAITAGNSGFADSFGAGLAYQQQDSKLVAVGSSYRGTAAKPFNYDYTIVRYNEDGSLDNSFGADGVVNIDFGSQNSDEATAVVTLANGNVMVVGKSQTAGEKTGCGLARLDSNGKVLGTTQASFGSGVSTCAGLAAQQDGKIVAVGTAMLPDGSNFGIIRFTDKGTVDTKFGQQGSVIQNVFGKDSATSVAIQAHDQKIVVAGSGSTNGLINVNTIIARYNPSGSLDTSFGKNGLSFVSVPSMTRMEPQGVIIDSHKNILVGASLMSADLMHHYPSIARVTAAGVLDKTVNSGKGYVIVPFAAIEHDASGAAGIALQANGNVLIAATVRSADSSIAQFGVARISCFASGAPTGDIKKTDPPGSPGEGETSAPVASTQRPARRNKKRGYRGLRRDEEQQE